MEISKDLKEFVRKSSTSQWDILERLVDDRLIPARLTGVIWPEIFRLFREFNNSTHITYIGAMIENSAYYEHSEFRKSIITFLENA